MMRRSQRVSPTWTLVAALPLLLVGAGALAGPAAPKAEPGPAPAPPAANESAETSAPKPGGEAGGGGGTVDKGVDVAAARTARTDLESAMGELDSMSSGAKADGDAVRAACLEEKVARGRDVMEVATGEIRILRDSKATGREKSLASEKLQAAADRMRSIVGEARGCAGDQSPEENDNVTRNDLDEQETIPVSDPTQGGAKPPVPLPVDPTTPQTVASPTQ